MRSFALIYLRSLRASVPLWKTSTVICSNFFKLLRDFSPNEMAVGANCLSCGLYADIPLELKRTPIVIGQLLWQPFDVRFKNFLDRLGFHRKVLHMELDILQLSSAQSNFRIQTQENFENQSFRNEVRAYFQLVGEMHSDFTQKKRGWEMAYLR